MKKKNLFALALMLMAAAMLTFTSCGKDDDDDDNNVDPIPEGIIGNWISEGDNIAPLLQGLNYVKITAEFKEDGSYHVEATDSEGVVIVFSGVYTMEESSVNGIWDITLVQNVPQSATSVGIFQIIETNNGREMKYEVVQTDPNLGFAPPTAEGGFGSTAGGAFGETNVQYYVEITD